MEWNFPKLLTFPGKTDQGIFTYVIDNEKPFLEKTASELNPQIAAYINDAKPIPGKTQILLTALGAGEIWGPNVNGDYFPESALAHEGREYGHKTFESHAKIFKHHVNKDPKASFGDVELSVYNPVYKRVELVVVLDNKKAPDIAERIDNGEYPDWSMGCRVPFDICSVCHNKAPTRKQYCHHAKYYLNKVDPETGKHVYVINTHPRFHDISQVLIGADRIAKTLMKVASQEGAKNFYLSSAFHAEKIAGTKKAEEQKDATLRKRIPAEDPPYSQQSLEDLVQSIPEVKSREKRLPEDTLERLALAPLGKSMSTMITMGMMPKPQEFQKIFLTRLGKKPLADMLDRAGVCFDPMMAEEPNEKHEKALDLDEDNFDEQLMHALAPHVPGRSYLAPHLLKRIVIMNKEACEQDVPRFLDKEACKRLEEKIAKDDNDERKPIGILPMLMTAAGAFSALNKKAPAKAAKGLDKLLVKSPGLAAALGISLVGTFNAMSGASSKGQYSYSGKAQSPDANDELLERMEKRREKPILKTGSVIGSAARGAGNAVQSSPAASRLLLGIPAAYMASGVLQKHREVNPYDEQGRVKEFVRKNPDVVSGALIADAALSTRGKGTHRLFQKYGPKIQSAATKARDQIKSQAEKWTSSSPGFAKTGSADEWLSSSLIWPLALGKKNLPGRVLGGVVDQAGIEYGSNLVQEKKRGRRKHPTTQLAKAASKSNRRSF